jgi:hypothetical protein
MSRRRTQKCSPSLATIAAFKSLQRTLERVRLVQSIIDQNPEGAQKLVTDRELTRLRVPTEMTQ